MLPLVPVKADSADQVGEQTAPYDYHASILSKLGGQKPQIKMILRAGVYRASGPRYYATHDSRHFYLSVGFLFAAYPQFATE